MQTKHNRAPDAVRSRKSRSGRRPGRGNADIVYTPPKPFNRRRFLLHLVTVLAVVLAVILGMSIFFKVENVYVSGVNKYTAWDVKEASGIQPGDNLLTLSRAAIAGRIKTNLAYVDDVRVGIKLPNAVNIEVIELDVVYAVEAEDTSWWLMSADGKVVEKTNSAAARAYTRILGVQMQLPEVGQQVQAYEEEAETTSPTEDSGQTEPQSDIPGLPLVTGRQKLERVLTILHQLEMNGIMGAVTSVNVSDITNMELWYGQHYQVLLGDDSRLDYKIRSMKAAVAQMGQYQSGILDVSFTRWPEEVGYTPF